ncbi:MAG: histidine kinase, partial [Clostridia bacterium]|nr:histidine kinase [Clostridia bacterium]
SGSFNRRILRSLLAVSISIMVLLSGVYFFQQIEMALFFIRTDISGNLAYAGEKLNLTFHDAQNLYDEMMHNDDLYRFFSGGSGFDNMSASEKERKINQIIIDCLFDKENIYQVQFLHSENLVSNGNYTYTTENNYDHADFYKKARSDVHSPFWVPTYDYTTFYHHPWMEELERMGGMELANRHLVSLVGELHLYSLQNGKLRFMPADVEPPVLVISILESYLSKVLDDITPFEGGQNMIAAEDGFILSHSDESRLMQNLDEKDAQFLRIAENGQRGTFEGQQCLIFYKELLPGWKIISVVPQSSIIRTALSNIAAPFLLVLAVALVLCWILSLSISRRLSQPIGNLMAAIDQAGHGDFRIHLRERKDEFGVLMSAFNEMATRIEVLIKENNDVRLREKENQLMALRYQTNPHFLYNALNILHMSAVQQGDEQTASHIIQLSRMMSYVIRDVRDLVPLCEELENVQQYFQLMQFGYNDAIHLQIEVEPGLERALLPKLSLQPLVENAVQHGLSGVRDGYVKIAANRLGGKIQIIVEDNGHGASKGYAIPAKESPEGSIGMSNVQKRLKLFFGESSELRAGPALESEHGYRCTLLFDCRMDSSPLPEPVNEKNSQTVKS